MDCVTVAKRYGSVHSANGRSAKALSQGRGSVHSTVPPIRAISKAQPQEAGKRKIPDASRTSTGATSKGSSSQERPNATTDQTEDTESDEDWPNISENSSSPDVSATAEELSLELRQEEMIHDSLLEMAHTMEVARLNNPLMRALGVSVCNIKSKPKPPLDQVAVITGVPSETEVERSGTNFKKLGLSAADLKNALVNYKSKEKTDIEVGLVIEWEKLCVALAASLT